MTAFYAILAVTSYLTGLVIMAVSSIIIAIVTLVWANFLVLNFGDDL
jgi:hypothetical protein